MATQEETYAKEVHKPVLKNFPRRQVYTYGKDDTWAADLADVSNKSNFNNKTTFLLTIVDIFSRYAWVFPLKNKGKASILKAFKTIGHYPKNLWTDHGGEFFNNDLKPFLAEHNVNLYYTHSDNKSVYVERFNRTLKEKLYKYMTLKNTKKYIDYLPIAVNEYNNRKHTTTRQTPEDVYINNKTPYHKITASKVRKIKFSVGDFVRITKSKGIFAKGYEAGCSRELFKIRTVNQSQEPVVYELEDLLGEEIVGNFYEEELQKSKFKENYKVFSEIVKQKTEDKKKMFLVRFKELPEKFDEWLTEKELKELKKMK
jgi:transposase InsO family protein/uncharacterized protein YktA (UPF0223 family)